MFRLQAQPARGGTSGDDDGFRQNLVLVVDDAAEWAFGEIHSGDHPFAHVGAEAQGLFADVVHDVGPRLAVGIAREVLHLRGDGELQQLSTEE